jgi:NhaA family Na+:H+ antiporter
MKMTIREFLKLESASGIILFIAAFLAILLDNSSWAHFYQQFFQMSFGFHTDEWHFVQPVLFWINEGLMTIFFLLVGLELKREFLEGELAGMSRIILPGVAALGGMLVPALIYLAVNYPHATMKGWSVPVATDIAFALSVLSLFGKRIPLGLKLFLLMLAIFDDMGAILIIAVCHSHSLSWLSMMFALLCMAVLQVFNFLNVRSLAPYLLIGILLWVSVLHSGVHATISGILLAMMIPLKNHPQESESTLRRLEDALHPWVVYFVMPLFAFANAGVNLSGLGWSILLDKVTLGIVLGLVLGKQLGVFSLVWLMVKMKWAKLPRFSNWLEMYGVACLCGIGFTMSLFLGTLAFQDDSPSYLTEVRVGVLLGSALSGLIGAMILYVAFLRKVKGGREIETP